MYSWGAWLITPQSNYLSEYEKQRQKNIAGCASRRGACSWSSTKEDHQTCNCKYTVQVQCKSHNYYVIKEGKLTTPTVYLTLLLFAEPLCLASQWSWPHFGSQESIQLLECFLLWERKFENNYEKRVIYNSLHINS